MVLAWEACKWGRAALEGIVRCAREIVTTGCTDTGRTGTTGTARARRRNGYPGICACGAYRSVSLEVVKQWLDWALGGGPAPPVAGERERGCASRAVGCFVRHSPVLGTALGQIVRDVGAGAASLWRTLVRLSKTEPILRFLQAKLKPGDEANGRRGFSLLGTYRCLAGGQPIFSVE